jgi:methylase of polypeptide subunit release factors
MSKGRSRHLLPSPVACAEIVIAEKERRDSAALANALQEEQRYSKFHRVKIFLACRTLIPKMDAPLLLVALQESVRQAQILQISDIRTGTQR